MRCTSRLAAQHFADLEKPRKHKTSVQYQKKALRCEQAAAGFAVVQRFGALFFDFT